MLKHYLLPPFKLGTLNRTIRGLNSYKKLSTIYITKKIPSLRKGSPKNIFSLILVNRTPHHKSSLINLFRNEIIFIQPATFTFIANKLNILKPVVP